MAERTLTVSQAEAIVRRSRPEAVVTEVISRTGGTLSGVYEVRFADPPDAVIVKIYAERWRWKLAKEVHVYRLLSGHSVPTILDAEQGTDLVGAAFAVMTKLPGRPLSEVVGELAPAAVHAVYRRLGAALAAVHGMRQDSFGYLTTEVLEPEPDNTAYMTRQFDRKLGEFAELGGARALLEAITTYVAERASLFGRCTGPVLCHNDFHEGNILVDRTGDGWSVTGFVDVENAVAADPLLDIAKTDYYSIRGDETKLAGFASGYGPVPDDDRRQLYRLYHALELWDWFAAIGDRAPLPGIAEDMRVLIGAPR